LEQSRTHVFSSSFSCTSSCAACRFSPEFTFLLFVAHHASSYWQEDRHI
jgi:hypothetical protein